MLVVGRGVECAAVERLLLEARESRSGALVVRGEPGIGKSALLGYAIERAEDLRVLKGASGSSPESELPFAALHRILLPVLDQVDGIPEPQADALRGAFGLSPGQASDRFLIAVGVLSLLAEAADEQPLLCVVDDAQWLDGASAEALAFAARRLEAEGVMLLFAARDGGGACSRWAAGASAHRSRRRGSGRAARGGALAGRSATAWSRARTEIPSR